MMEYKVKLKEIGFEITKKCNFGCIHCYLEKNSKQELDIDFIKNFIVNFGDDFNTIYITGGEPLCHKNFLEIFKLIIKSGYFTMLFTNASMFTEDIFNEFKKNIPHKIKISIYGMSDETYNKVTHRRGMFKQVIRNIQILKSFNANISLKFILLNENKRDLKQFLSFSKKNNLPYTIYTNMLPIIDENNNLLNLTLSSDHLKSIFQEAQIYNYNEKSQNCNFCDAGKNIFIDSGSILRGCPVLKTKYDCPVSNISNNIKFNNIRDKIATYCKDKPSCPAFLNLQESV